MEKINAGQPKASFAVHHIEPVENVTPEADIIVSLEHTETGAIYSHGFNIEPQNGTAEGNSAKVNLITNDLVGGIESVLSSWKTTAFTSGADGETTMFFYDDAKLKEDVAVWVTKNVQRTDLEKEKKPSILVDFRLTMLPPGDGGVCNFRIITKSESKEEKTFLFGFSLDVCRVAEHGIEIPAEDLTDYIERDADYQVREWLKAHPNAYRGEQYQIIHEVDTIRNTVEFKLDGMGPNPEIELHFENRNESSFTNKEQKVKSTFQATETNNSIDLPTDIEMPFANIRFQPDPSIANYKDFDDLPDHILYGVHTETGKVRNLYVKVEDKILDGEYDRFAMIQLLAKAIKVVYQDAWLAPPMDAQLFARGIHNSRSPVPVETSMDQLYFEDKAKFIFERSQQKAKPMADVPYFTMATAHRDRHPTEERNDKGLRLCLNIEQGAWAFEVLHTDKPRKIVNNIYGTVMFAGEKRIFSFRSAKNGRRGAYLKHLPIKFLEGYILGMVLQTLDINGIGQLIDVTTLDFDEDQVSNRIDFEEQPMHIYQRGVGRAF